MKGGVLLALASTIAGCASQPAVDRVLDGEIVRDRFIGSDAYAAFMTGALAEADGDVAGASRAYRRAAELDANSADVLVHLASMYCRAGRRDEGAQALAEARGREPTNGALPNVERECAPPATATLPMLEARLLTEGMRPELAMTAATLALSANKPHRAAELAAHAVRRSTVYAPRAASVVGALVKNGSLVHARALAAALVDAAPVGNAGHGRVTTTVGAPLVLKLALDEAILSGSPSKLEARATKGGIAMGEAAGRALLWGERALARHTLTALDASSPREAALVRIVLGDAAVMGVSKGDGDAEIAPSLRLALALRSEVALDPDAARLVAALVVPERVDESDPLVAYALNRLRRSR